MVTATVTPDGMSIIAEVVIVIVIVIVIMRESAVAAPLAVRLVAHRTSAMNEASRLAVGAEVMTDMIPVIKFAKVVTVVTGQNAIVDLMVTATAHALRTSVPSKKAISVRIVQVHLRHLTAVLGRLTPHAYHDLALCHRRAITPSLLAARAHRRKSMQQ